MQIRYTESTEANNKRTAALQALDRSALRVTAKAANLVAALAFFADLKTDLDAVDAEGQRHLPGGFADNVRIVSELCATLANGLQHVDDATKALVGPLVDLVQIANPPPP